MQTPFRILTIGWDASFIRKMLAPLQENLGFAAYSGMLGDPDKIDQADLPQGIQAIPLSPKKNHPLPPADLQFLASLERPDVPTVRNMILGDRILNQLPSETALAYASDLGKKIEKAIHETKPDIVLGTFDSLHSGMGLAVARSADVPWLSLVYLAIPAGITAFSTQMNPNALLPITRPKDAQLYKEVQEIIDRFRHHDPELYRNVEPNDSRFFTVYLVGMHIVNLIRRFTTEPEDGRDPYTWPTIYKRTTDIVRRTWNGVTLPKRQLIDSPPEEPYVYFPLHMQPESTVDNWAPFCQDQFGLAKQVLRALPANQTLVVKLHYIDPDNYSRSLLRDFLKLPGVKIANPLSQSRQFLEGANLVIGIQGTVCLEAAIIGKPTLIFGDSPYQYFPNTERAEGVDQLQKQIKQLLERVMPSDDQITESLADYLSRFQQGSCNDWSKSPTAVEMKNMTKLFQKLIAFYQQPDLS